MSTASAYQYSNQSYYFQRLIAAGLVGNPTIPGYGSAAMPAATAASAPQSADQPTPAVTGSSPVYPTTTRVGNAEYGGNVYISYQESLSMVRLVPYHYPDPSAYKDSLYSTILIDDASLLIGKGTFTISNRGNLPANAAITTRTVQVLGVGGYKPHRQVVLSATFSTMADYQFTVTLVVPLENPAFTTSFNYPFTVKCIDRDALFTLQAYSAPQITLDSLYEQTLLDANGDATFTLADRGNLPAGAVLNAVGTTAVEISAIFTVAGVYTFAIKAVSTAGLTQGVEKTITLTLKTTSAQPAVFLVQLRESFSATVSAAFSAVVGTATYGSTLNAGTFSFAHRGNLPSNAALNATTGVLTATFPAEQEYRCVILVTKADDETVFERRNLRIVAGLPPPPTPTLLPPAVMYTEAAATPGRVTVRRFAKDDSSGRVLPTKDSAGTVDYETGVIEISPEITFDSPRWISPQDNVPESGTWSLEAITDQFTDGDPVSVIYTPMAAINLADTVTLPVSVLRFSLTPLSTDRIVPGTVRFTLGATVYEDSEGVIQHTVNPSTGVGTPCGTIHYGSGEVTLTDWVGGASGFSLQSLATYKGQFTDREFSFSTTKNPVQPGGFQVAVTALDGELLVGSSDLAGVISGDSVEGEINFENGIFIVRFGARVLDSSLSAEEKLESWYDAANVDGTGHIWRPREVVPSTARYNAVAYTYTPVDSELIGIDTARLPADGRVQVIKPGDTAVLHHTAAFTMPNPLSAAQVVNLPRGNLSQVVVLDTAGTQVATTKYSVNLTAGVVTMANPLDLSAYLQPLAAHHTLREMARVADVEISGQIQLARPLTKTFPADGYLSTVLTAGDRYARYANLRVIASWQGSFTVDGSLAVADYNDVDYPIVVTNQGCIEEDWALVFETTTTVKVIGARVGQIASGLSIASTIAPVSALTGIPYFSIASGGWGSGYVYGNALRFPTIAASFPHWHIRCTQPHDWTGGGDVYAFQTLGEVDP